MSIQGISMDMTAFGPLVLQLTPAELLVIATLDEVEIPPPLVAWIAVIDADDEHGELSRAARAKEAISSLSARGFLESSGEELRISAIILRMIKLVCEGEWVLETLTATDSEASFDLRVSGIGDEGVLARGAPFGCLELFYRPDAFQALPDLLSAIVGPRDDDASNLSNDADIISLDELTKWPSWTDRVFRSVTVCEAQMGEWNEYPWLVLGDARFVLTAEHGVTWARPISSTELEEELHRLIAFESNR